MNTPVLHLADDLFDHAFGVFHAVDQIVQVGRQDIADALKNIRHTARLLLRSC